MKNLIKYVLILVAVFGFLSLSAKTYAYDPLDAACKNAAGNSPACQQNDNTTGQLATNPISGPKGVIQEAATVFTLVAVIGALITIVYSGFVFVTAGGSRAGDNSTRARNARTTIISAATGIIIVSFA